MRYAFVAVCFVLGLAAVAAATLCFAGLPHALSLMQHEPEDVYLLVFWAIVATCLAAFWFGAAVHVAVGLPQLAARLLRVATTLAVGLGVLLAVIVPWAPLA